MLNRTIKTGITLFVCCLLLQTIAIAAEETIDQTTDQTPEQTTGKNGQSVIFPVLGYTSDTGFLIGATYLRFFRLEEPTTPEDPPSIFSPVLVYSSKKQIILFLGSEYYFGDNHVGLVPGYMKFPNKYYGIGNSVSKDAEEDYTPERYTLEAFFDREIYKKLSLGVGYSLKSHQLLETEAAGALATGNVPGTGKSTISAPGVRLIWDSRDNSWAAASGLWLQCGINFADESTGSDFDYTQYLCDFRYYKTLNDRFSVASQVYYNSIDGQAPFYELPGLGGQSGLRGYSSGLYLDNTCMLARTELRTANVWGKLGTVLFAGIGDVAARPANLSLSYELYTFGFGLRYTLNEENRVNVRVDWGFGNDDSSFFLSVGEAF